jgi:metal-dependent hydrolase (beta-lactamase superfamily II)
MQVMQVFPSHCTSMEAHMAFAREWKSPTITSGSVINFPSLIIEKD